MVLLLFSCQENKKESNKFNTDEQTKDSPKSLEEDFEMNYGIILDNLDLFTKLFIRNGILSDEKKSYSNFFLKLGTPQIELWREGLIFY